MGTRRTAGQGVAANVIAKLRAPSAALPLAPDDRTMHDFKGVDWNLRARNGKVDPGFVREFLEGIMASDWFACEIRDESGRIVAGFDGEHLWTEQPTQVDAA